VKQVGRELGMRYVLEGSVRKPGNRVRITAQLAETETGAHVWADRFDGVLENIFDLQDEITASIVSAIQPQLRDAELNRARRQRPKSPTAYDCLLRGMARYYSVSREENDATMQLLRRAIASDPEWSWRSYRNACRATASPASSVSLNRASCFPPLRTH
jgi:adenylate cyclase